jgi:hypothetical protein
MKPNNNHFSILPNSHIVFFLKPNNNHFPDEETGGGETEGNHAWQRAAVEVPDVEHGGGSGGDRRR